jgi:RNA ligase
MGYKETIKEVLYQSLQTMTVEEFNKYRYEISEGYIKMNHHPEDENIVILNYTELTTFDKRWNNETMSARGLILDLTEAKDNGIIYILAKPFEKFPNFGSNEIIGYEDDIDFSETPIVMEKMDGSLGISYFFDGEIRFATRGSFTSDQAIRATEIWNKKYAKFMGTLDTSVYVLYPFTLLVEIIYPENRVVVDYDGLEDLVLLGAIDIGKEYYGQEWSYTMCKHYATDLKMPIAEQFILSIDEMIDLKKTMSANEEGFILRFSNNKRLKIKGDEYLQVHRIKHGMSDKAKFRAWAEESLNDYIMQLPEEFRPELEEFGATLDGLAFAIHTMVTLIFLQAKDKHGDDRKAFAIHVNSVVDKEFRKFVFTALDKGKVPMEMVRKYILDNYKDYLEVVAWNKQDS